MAFTVQMVSPCGVRHDLYCGLEEWEANDICQRNNWQYFDEYGVEWSLDYVGSHEHEDEDEDYGWYDDEDDPYADDSDEDDPHGIDDVRDRIKSIVDNFAKMNDELEDMINDMDELYEKTQSAIKACKDLRYEMLRFTMKNKTVKKLQLVHLDFTRAKQSTNKEEYRKEFFVYMQREDC